MLSDKNKKQKLNKTISFRINEIEYSFFEKLTKEQKTIKSIQLRNFIKKLILNN